MKPSTLKPASPTLYLYTSHGLDVVVRHILAAEASEAQVGGAREVRGSYWKYLGLNAFQLIPAHLSAAMSTRFFNGRSRIRTRILDGTCQREAPFSRFRGAQEVA